MNGFERFPAFRASIMIVDSDAGQRNFAHSVLRRGDWRIEAYAEGEQALAAARRERPSLVLLEVRLDDISGYEVCHGLQSEYGESVGIIFMSHDRTEPSDKEAGLLLGADDYLTKPLEGSELLARVIAVLRRVSPPPAPKLKLERRSELTRRELEVLRLLALGLDQPEIARQLVIASGTVGKHIEHILDKLPARSRAEAVAIAYQRHLHEPPDSQAQLRLDQ